MSVHYAEDSCVPVPDMSALIARLEAAEAGSRELSRSVLTALGGIDRSDPRDACDTWAIANHWFSGTSVTSSLDDALALAERVLPDHMRGPISLCIAGSAEAYIDHVDPCGDSVKAFGKTPALALCICILEATRHGYEGEAAVSPNLKAKAQGEGG